jgi:hypothetical protein
METVIKVVIGDLTTYYDPTVNRWFDCATSFDGLKADQLHQSVEVAIEKRFGRVEFQASGNYVRGDIHLITYHLYWYTRKKNTLYSLRRHYDLVIVNAYRKCTFRTVLLSITNDLRIGCDSRRVRA